MNTDAQNQDREGDMTIQNWDETELIGFFIYLDNLRANGVTNMLGASPYLAEQFDLERSDARTILGAWISTFSEDPVEERVSVARD